MNTLLAQSLAGPFKNCHWNFSASSSFILFFPSLFPFDCEFLIHRLTIPSCIPRWRTKAIPSFPFLFFSLSSCPFLSPSHSLFPAEVEREHRFDFSETRWRLCDRQRRRRSQGTAVSRACTRWYTWSRFVNHHECTDYMGVKSCIAM